MGQYADDALEYYWSTHGIFQNYQRKNKKQGNLMTSKTISKTQYISFVGTGKWCKIYKPDEFKGAVRWLMNFYPESPEEWKKFKDAGIQKKVNKDEDGEYFSAARPTTKMILGKIVHFTPPIVYDKNGDVLVGYYNDEDKLLRSYNDENKKIIKKGENVLIGNGSKVEITLCVYPTAMGPGNRLESIKILDLIEYAPEPEQEPVEDTAVKW